MNFALLKMYFIDLNGNESAKIMEMLNEISEVEYNKKVPNN